MTQDQLHILQHSLGADQYGRRERYGDRNHFCAGGKDEDICKELVALGYMVQHETTSWLPYYNCSATGKGINAML